MDEALDALCLSPDLRQAAPVTAMLAKLPGFTVRSREADYQGGLRDLREPDLVIVILDAESMVGLAVIEEVHRNAPGARVLALCEDENPERMIRAMRAGADEFLPLPVTSTDLLKVCIKVSATRHCSLPSQNRRGEVWVAYGRGGVGVTTLIANLAFALRAVGRDAALVDLDTYNADLATFLNLTPTYTLQDIATEFRRLDSVFLQGTMSRHASGLELLAAPAAVAGQPPLEIASDHCRAILDLVSSLHEVTLVDTPGVLSEATQAAMAVASRILLVTELTVPSLRSCLRILDWLREDGIDGTSRVEVIANKQGTKAAEVPPAEAAKTLRVPLHAVLPRDDVAALAAINSGQALREVRAGSFLAKAIDDLIVPATARAETGAKRKGLMRFFAAAEKGA